MLESYRHNLDDYTSISSDSNGVGIICLHFESKGQQSLASYPCKLIVCCISAVDFSAEQRADVDLPEMKIKVLLLKVGKFPISVDTFWEKIQTVSNFCGLRYFTRE